MLTGFGLMRDVRVVISTGSGRYFLMVGLFLMAVFLICRLLKQRWALRQPIPSILAAYPAKCLLILGWTSSNPLKVIGNTYQVLLNDANILPRRFI